ncbi:MAG: hypothetical protein RJA76_1586 [Bacteroidota bacterium]|jgi:DNA repair protein RadC
MTSNQFTFKKILKEDRPREKLKNLGKEYLSNSEILAIILGSGTKSKSVTELSNEIIHQVGGNLNSFSRLGLSDLVHFKGIGKAKATQLLACIELGKRIATYDAKNKLVKISSSADAFILLRPIFQELIHEEFWVIYLNRGSKVIKVERLSKGGVAGTTVDIKLIYRSAIHYIASSLIVAHNHPSGNLIPSHSDKEITKKIAEAGKNLDILLIDHLIIADNTYVSFVDEGWL